MSYILVTSMFTNLRLWCSWSRVLEWRVVCAVRPPQSWWSASQHPCAHWSNTGHSHTHLKQSQSCNFNISLHLMFLKSSHILLIGPLLYFTTFATILYCFCGSHLSSAKSITSLCFSTINKHYKLHYKNTFYRTSSIHQLIMRNQ